MIISNRKKIIISFLSSFLLGGVEINALERPFENDLKEDLGIDSEEINEESIEGSIEEKYDELDSLTVRKVEQLAGFKYHIPKNDGTSLEKKLSTFEKDLSVFELTRLHQLKNTKPLVKNVDISKFENNWNLDEQNKSMINHRLEERL